MADNADRPRWLYAYKEQGTDFYYLMLSSHTDASGAMRFFLMWDTDSIHRVLLFPCRHAWWEMYENEYRKLNKHEPRWLPHDG